MKPPKSESAKLNRYYTDDETGEMLKRTWSKIAFRLNHQTILKSQPESRVINGRLSFFINYWALVN